VCSIPGTVQQQRRETDVTNFEWARHKLFRRLSMNSALIESQSNTYMLGGSSAYMTARDWNRFGLLYLLDGVWVDGSRFFREGWVNETKTPSEVDDGCVYYAKGHQQ